MPPSVASFGPHEKEEEVTSQEIPSKRKKEATKYEKNDKVVDTWKLRNTETWNTVFRHKVSEGPQLSVGCKPYLKCRVKGGCFSDYKMRKSHCVLAPEDKKKTEAFIKSLKGE